MSRIGDAARKYGFDVLIALLAIEAALELVVRRDSRNAPDTTLWLTVPAVAIMGPPLFARRRFPVGAPAAFWLLAAFSFVDGRLVAFPIGVFLVGMGASFLLGNLRDAQHA